MYKISVVVATYNSGDFLSEFLDSIKSQSLGFEDIEVIFVDDASTDSCTLDLLHDFNKKYSNVSAVFLDENSGFPGTGRNRGLDLAGGEYVIFADHDDSYVENAFEVMYNEISKENADFLITNYYKVYEMETVKEKTVFDGENVVVNSFKDDLRLFDIGPSIWTKLFKKDFLVENKIEPVFAYGFPKDKMDELQRAQLELQMKLSSRKDIMERMGKQNIPELLDEIDEDTIHQAMVQEQINRLSGFGTVSEQAGENTGEETGENGLENEE